MFFAAQLDAFGVSATKLSVIPAFYFINFKTFTFFVGSKSCQSLRDAAFGGLQIARHGDAVAIVPHRHGHGNLEHAGGIHGFPKNTF